VFLAYLFRIFALPCTTCERGRRKEFFQGRATGDFSNFFRGTKVVKFEISHSKLKKQPFAVIFKNQRRAKPPPATPLSDAHTCETKCDFSALRCIKNYSDQGATSSSFRGGQFSWNFIRWRHCAYSTVVQLFRKRSHIKILYFCPQTRSP